MRILNALLEITVFSTGIFALTALVKRVFRNRMSPRMHYAVWFLLILRLLLPVTPESPVRFFSLPAAQARQTAFIAEHPADDGMQAGAEEPLPAEPDADAAGEPVSHGTQTAPESVGTLSNESRRALPPYAWILIVWLAGAGAGICYIALVYARMLRRIKREAVRPPERVLRLYRQVKREMGIRAGVRLVCLSGRGSPGLLFPARVLLPLGAMADLNDEQIRQVLRHELMHYLRKDQYACLLLSVLNAVYFFHPVVWIAVRRIRADMETACDGDVVRSMTPGEKGDYAALVLELFSKSGRGQVVPGMADWSTRRIAEQRIRGIFMNRKSGWSAKLVCGVLSFAVLLGGFTTACVPRREAAEPASQAANAAQPTPDATFGIVEDTNTPAPTNAPVSRLAETLNVPAHWRYEGVSADGQLTVRGDLTVTLPAVNAVPTARAVCREVTTADLQRAADAFFGPGAAFTLAARDTREYAEKYLEKNREIYESIIDGTSENKLASFRKSVINQYEAYRDMAKTAPSASERRAVPLSFTERVEVTGDTYMGFRGVSEKYGADYLVSAANTARGSAINIAEVYDDDLTLGYFGTYRDAPEGLALTRAEAISAASGMAALIDADLALCHAMPVGLFENAAETEARAHPWAWQCIFMRRLNGVGTVYDSRDVGSDIDSNVFGRVNEALEITVDDRGICGVHWINPMTVTEVTSRDAALLPFDTVAAALPDRLREKYDYDITRESGEQTHVLFIREAELGLMRVGAPGGKEFTLEPVWSFFIDFAENPDYSDPNLQRAAYDGDPRRWNSLTLSAIDGRVIDRDAGV